MKFPAKIRRDLQPSVRLAATHHRLQLRETVHALDHAKSLRVHKRIDQLTAVRRPVFVVHRDRHVFHVVIEREPERDDLQQGREKHEEQRRAVAEDDDELLVKNRPKTTQKLRHLECHAGPPAYCLVSATKTSSSDGPIGRISTLRIPALPSASRINCSGIDSSTRKCIDWPNTVEARTPSSLRTARRRIVTWSQVTSSRLVPGGFTAGNCFKSSGAPQTTSFDIDRKSTR